MSAKHHLIRIAFTLALAIGLASGCAIEDEYGMSVDLAQETQGLAADSDDSEVPPQPVMVKLNCNADCTCPPAPEGCTPHHILCWRDSDTNTCRNMEKACEYWCPAKPAPVE